MSDVAVSRNTRPRPRDHQTKAGKPTGKKGIASITVETDPASGAALALCSCGAEKFHRRRKIVEDWAEAHVNKRHKGRAYWR